MPSIQKLLGLGASLLMLISSVWGQGGYNLVVEAAPAVTPGSTTYRFYVNLPNPSDRFSAVFGNDQASLIVNTPAGAVNSTFNASWNASGINAAFLPLVPDLADDSYATIGLEGPASTSGIAGAADPSVVEDASQPITPYFLTNGATLLESTTLTGASWYVLNTAANGLPDANGRVLIMQVTTSGSISGQINYQVFPLGVGADQLQISAAFDGAGTFGPADGCTDPSACNFDPEATDDDGSCLELDCNGDCGGTAMMDECGMCNGPGAVYECGCTDIPAGDCDCNGNQLDECGVCGGNGIPAGDCDCDGNQLDALGVCGGGCTEDADADGICDDVDDCVGEDADADGICDTIDDCIGELDACGVCNGPGAIYECGCTEIPEGDCDCNGTQLDALWECGGDCEADVDTDGICDDEDPCVGQFDQCGLCNGEGAIYECGCTDIPTGDCDCNGNQLDALGACGGDCAADADADGICDDVDECVGELDACGVCNGPGEAFECGCSDIPVGDCDCEGNQLDAVGTCGGDCAEDADADGICDDEDPCVGDTVACCTDYNQNSLCDADEVVGCTFPGAVNYDPAATMDNGTCIEACQGDLNGDGQVQLQDLLDFLLLFGVDCE